jgi:hypothetical protein
MSVLSEADHSRLRDEADHRAMIGCKKFIKAKMPLATLFVSFEIYVASFSRKTLRRLGGVDKW